MSPEPLRHVLQATGYLLDGEPAPGVQLGETAQRSRRRSRDFVPDALWRSPSALTVYFKSESTTPSKELVGAWQREIWNEGFAPLLWVISPERIDVYNGFGTPVNDGDAREHLLRTFGLVESALRELDEFAGRIALETGQFWLQDNVVDRKTGVDQKLLSDLAHLEHDLVESELARSAAQALIGRVIFTQYLIDRGIVDAPRLKRVCGHKSLSAILRDRAATERLFLWLSQKFNGDMFPPSAATTPKTSYLSRVADFLEAVDPATGQQSFFPYQFDVIPVELISSIYEQFTHAVPARANKKASEAVQNGVHYTRLSLVSLVLDEVMEDLTGKETVLDLTCGSGVFLVEALRRLVSLRAQGQQPTREVIRSTLYEQLFGVDISEAAIRVGAFSLYLAALELDPDPHPPEALRFRPLIGKTLMVGDARTIGHTDDEYPLATKNGLRRFDVIVGNPPWGFRGRGGTAARRRTRTPGIPAQPRGEGLDFVLRAAEFSHERTRFGIVLSAMPFFSRSGTGMAAAQHVLRMLAPVTLVNLSNLCSWLFATATMPAVVLLARHRPQDAEQVTIVQIPWSPGGARTHTFDVSSSNILRLPLDDVEKYPVKLKAAAVGRNRDLVLLESLTTAHHSFGDWLATLKTELHVGLIRGLPRNQNRDARQLRGLELLGTKDIERFHIREGLSRFNQAKAQWPRDREIYRAPLLVVKETLSAGARPIVALSDRDLVFTNTYFGASFPPGYSDSIRLLSGILSSSLASWFFVITASEFGLWKRRLLRHDVAQLPIPDLKPATRSVAGKRVLKIVNRLTKADSDDGWSELDEAVFDLYQLDRADRVVAEDGLFRATWQWQEGREHSVEPADVHSDVSRYATVFLSTITSWLSARNKRWMRAEVFDLREGSALRVVRFVLEDGPGTSTVDVVNGHDGVAAVLGAIGQRLHVKLSNVLSGNREIRVHGRNEVVIIKPAARRYWLGVAALEDADSVVAESLTGSIV